jgi:hypothetical protein
MIEILEVIKILLKELEVFVILFGLESIFCLKFVR